MEHETRIAKLSSMIDDSIDDTNKTLQPLSWYKILLSLLFVAFVLSIGKLLN